MNRNHWFATVLLAGLLATGLACGGRKPLPDEPDTAPVDTRLRFEDITKKAGVDFVHFDSATPMHYIHEVMGSGIAWIDYDGDGRIDLFCVQDGPVFPKSASGPLPTSRLYRNNGGGTFTDVTARVGLDQPGFGMGVAAGDFDNDGFDDLLVTYFDSVRLYHNQPDGKGGRRFVNVTQKAGLHNPNWATSCGWGDVDGDGYLDLYICNYVEVDLANYKPCTHPTTKERHVCPPRVFTPARHRFYRNNGNGTFTDATASSGIGAVPPAPGLGVVLVDLDDDGKLDIYAANDMMPAYLFHNQGNGKMRERGVLSGCALQANGRYLAGMGIAVGDFDGSGRPSLFVTNYQDEPNNLFLNRGKLTFQDWTHPSGLGPASVPFLAFGAVIFDADLDGRPDVAVANGHVLRNAESIDGVPSRQTAQMFESMGQGRFRDVTRAAGAYFQSKLFGRGLAVGDFDNDGKPDLVFSHNPGPLALLRNTSDTTNHFVRLELIGDGKKSNRNAIGARVAVVANGKTQYHWISGGGSYLSGNDRRILAGLGPANRIERVEVRWPSGTVQEWRNLEADRAYRLQEGQPKASQVGR